MGQVSSTGDSRDAGRCLCWCLWHGVGRLWWCGRVEEEQECHVGCVELRDKDPAEGCDQEQLGSLVLPVPPPSQPSYQSYSPGWSQNKFNIKLACLLVRRAGRAREGGQPKASRCPVGTSWAISSGLSGARRGRVCMLVCPVGILGRMGRSHTQLLISRCREEDAGIYQASARNNKGIVSCSGVLEVGTMTEFKIHQKWFDKIKRKAEEKLQEIEQGKKRGKENVEVEKLQGMSPERLQRKRRLARDQNLRSGDSSWEKEDAAKVHVADSQSGLHKDIAETKEQPLNVVPGFPNQLVAPLKAEVTTNGDATLESGEENGNNFLTYIYETVEDLATKPGAKDSAAKKKKKVEAPSAATEEVSKREESGRDRANPSSNPRFAPPVPLRRNARLRAASDQEVETSPKLKEPGKAVKQDTKTNDDVYFSLKDMYFDKQGKPAAGKEEVGAKDKAGSEAALRPVEVSRQTEDAPLSSEVLEARPVLSEGQRGQQQEQKLEGNKEVTRRDNGQHRGGNKKTSVLRICIVALGLVGCLHPTGSAAEALQVSTGESTQEMGFLDFVSPDSRASTPSPNKCQLRW